MSEQKNFNPEELQSLIEDSVKKSVSKAMGTQNLIKNIFPIIQIVAIVFGFIWLYNNIKPKQPEEVIPVEEQDVTLENNGIFGFKAADFEDVILGEASRKQLLIVDEQEVSVNTKVTEAGWFNWKSTSKVTHQVIYGTGIYTVDLTKIDKKDISLDEHNYTITIHIPYPELYKVTFEPEKTETISSEKGLLTWGDLELSLDEMKTYEIEANNKLDERLRKDDCFEEAERFAKLSAYELYQPIVNRISPAYKVEIVVDDRPVNSK